MSKPKKEVTHKYPGEVYIATSDFGLEFEDGTPGIINKGECLTILEVSKNRNKVKLEKIGWTGSRSAVFRFMKKYEPHQYTIEEYLNMKNELNKE